MRVINGNYQFSTTPSFGALVPITAPAYLAPTNPPTAPGTPGAGTVTIGTQISSNFSRIYRLQTSNQPSPLPTPLATNTATFTSTFSTILVRTVNMTDGDDTPSFTLIGSSQTVTKSLLVDLNDSATNTPISGSSIVIGAPVAITESGLTIGPTLVSGVATIAGFATPSGPAMPAASPSGVFPGGPLPEGSVLLRGESITVSSSGISVNAGQPIYMVSQRGASSALNAGGININSRISTAGDFNAEVIGTAFNINAGGQVSNGASGLAASVIVDATDADVFIPGKVLATDQYYFMQASQEASPNVKARMISTRPGGTGAQSGLLTADELIVYLANENDDAPAPGVDGVVDLQTSTNRLRITSATASGGGPLDNVITVKNNRNLTVDAVAASAGDISLSTSAGTIDLQAAIDTVGSFSLAAFDTLTVDSAISSAEDISLTSTNGGVTIAAAIQTANSGTLLGKVTITGKNDVKIDSLVNAEYEGVTVTSQTGKIYSSVNLALSPTSRVTSPSTKLTAATGIDLGTDVGVIDAAVIGTGAITVDDSGASGYAAFLTVNSASTSSGNVTIKSAQTVDVLSLVAGGTGDASVTSTSGNVNLTGSVIAVDNVVTLTAAKFAADGTTVLNSGFITGLAPIAAEINWTAKNVVDDATRSAITASDYVGATATFETAGVVADGELFYFTGPAATVPEGFSLGTAYYVVNSVLGAPNTFQLALTPGGLVEGGLTDLPGPIGLEPGNADLYRNIPVVSAYRLSTGSINFTADNSTTLKSIKTTDGDVNVTSAGGSIVATGVIATAGVNFIGDVVLDARNGGVTLGSVATTSAGGTVTVFASQAITDDGNAATTGITANTIKLSAATGGVASDIGSAASRVTVAGVSTGIPVALTIAKAAVADYPAALDASSVYIGASSGLGLNATAVNLVDVKATGASTDVEVQTVALSDADGKAVLFAGRNLTVGDVTVAGGTFGDASSISLEAGGRLVNANGVGTDTTLEAYTLTLKASTFDGSFDVTNLDTFSRLTAAAAAAGGAVNFRFDRAKSLTLDGITTVGGNVAISNNAGGPTLSAGSYTGATNTFATTASPINGQQFAFGYGSVIPAGFEAGVAYFIVNAVANTSFKLALTAGGPAVGGAANQALPMTLGAAARTVQADAYDGATKTFNTSAVAVTGQQVYFAEGSVIPDGFAAGSLYYVVNSALGAGGLPNTFQLALTPGGAAVGGATAVAQPMTLESDASLRVGAGGITAGTASSANTVTLTTFGNAISGPADSAQTTGTIFAASSVTLAAADEITAVTKAGQLVAKADSSIEIAQTGNTKIGSGGIATNTGGSQQVTLAVTGSILSGTGKITTDVATVSATTGLDIKTNVKTLSATAAAGNVTVVEDNGLEVGTAGITAAAGAVSLTLTKGTLSGGGPAIKGNSVGLFLQEAGNSIDVDTSTSSLTASTKAGTVAATSYTGATQTFATAASLTNGQQFTFPGAPAAIPGGFTAGVPYFVVNAVANTSFQLALTPGGVAVGGAVNQAAAMTLTGVTGITVRNDKSMSIGAAGIVVGNTAADDVSLTVTNGAITTGTGSIKADAVALSATTGIAANTSANSLSATSTAGNIALTQTGKAVTLTSLVAANGGVTVTNNDNIAVTQVQAIGSGKNVSLTATGVNKKIAFGAGAISADGDSVSLVSTGGLYGTKNGAAADITAASITLGSSGGDVNATVKATTIAAGASGTDTGKNYLPNVPAHPADLNLTVLGPKALFVGTSTGLTLGASGNVTLGTLADPATPPTFCLPIIVVASPTAGGTVTYNTDRQVTFAVSTGAATGAGSLSQALTDAGAATVTGGGTTGVGFSSTLTSPIQLSSTLPITKQTTLDGTQRLNLATGSIVVGRAIDIDGSKLAGASTAGFALSGAADNSVIRGFAFYGFNKVGGAAVSLAPSADNVKIENNLFGVSTGGAASGNTVGILANGAINNLAITGNTVVKSSDAGIRLGANVTNAAVTGNLIGTNSARTALGNKIGIDVTGAGAGNTIGGTGTDANVIANNSVAGVQVTNTVGGTTIRGNEVLQNATGILVNGTSDTVTIAGNTVTRNTADGVVVNGTSKNVMVGGAAAADRNFIGTTSTNALGLGNARNGVVVSSTGTGNAVQNNVILGNGTANVAGDNAGVKVTGATANGVSITGNTINANRGAGILAARTGGGVVTLQRNTIASNSGSGVQANAGAFIVVGSSASVPVNDPTLRSNANTINSNARYGVEVLAGAFGQIAGNSMASNTLGGILNAALTAPTVTSATRSAATGQLTVTISGVANGQVVDVYTGTDQGRVYLGRVVAGGTTATFTMTLAQQNTAGVSAAVFVGAPITATRSTTGANGQTSRFSAVRSITRS